MSSITWVRCGTTYLGTCHPLGIFTHHCQNIVDQTIGTDAALQNTIHALVPAIAGGGTAKEQTARYEVTQVQGQGYGNGN